MRFFITEKARIEEPHDIRNQSSCDARIGLRENGYKQTSLSVQKDNPAVRFYGRLGYTMSDERLDHAGHEDYLMIKADFLRQMFSDVTPAYHMNKTHWNTITLGSGVPENELKRMIENSYNLIIPKVKKHQNGCIITTAQHRRQ